MINTLFVINNLVRKVFGGWISLLLFLCVGASQGVYTYLIMEKSAELSIVLGIGAMCAMLIFCHAMYKLVIKKKPSQ